MQPKIAITQLVTHCIMQGVSNTETPNIVRRLITEAKTSPKSVASTRAALKRQGGSGSSVR